jgi:hypothetical protein
MRGMLRWPRKSLQRGGDGSSRRQPFRRQPGAEPNYRYGIVRLYLNPIVLVVPVAGPPAHSATLQIPRLPGTIRVKFLEPIMPPAQKDRTSQPNWNGASRKPAMN